MNRKNFWLATFTCLSGFVTLGQPVYPIINIYAYKQVSLPGILPATRVDEQGNPVQQEYTPRFNYWIYVESPATEKITVSDLWIAGKRFLVKSEEVMNRPVRKIINSGATYPDTVVLVPGTNNPVTLVYPAGERDELRKKSRNLVKLTRQSELVLGYTWKGKKYFTSPRSVRKLDPDVRQ